MRSINAISPEKQSCPWERGICSLTDPRDVNASPTGGGAGNRDFTRPTGNYCNALAASSFEGLEGSGFMGSGGFRPPALEFAARRNACVQTKIPAPVINSGGLNRFPTPSPATAPAPTVPPFIFVLIAAILFIGKGWN